MNAYRGIFTGKVTAARIRPGADLLKSIEELVSGAGYRAGAIELIGSVRKANLACYDQVKKEYVVFSIREPLEVVAGVGNVSLRDGKPFVHVHLTLSDESGRCYGGHLVEGTETFVAEVLISEIAMERPLVREKDEETGLHLWPST